MHTQKPIAYLAARSPVAPSMFPAREFCTLADAPVFEMLGSHSPGRIVARIGEDRNSNASWVAVQTGRGFILPATVPSPSAALPFFP